MAFQFAFRELFLYEDVHVSPSSIFVTALLVRETRQ